MLQYNPSITGSLQVTGSLVVTGNIIASGSITISGSVASASYAEFLGGLPSSSFASASVFNEVSSSYAAASASLSTRVTTLESASESFAAQSASLSTRVTNLEATSSTVSSSFATTSGSIAGRVTCIEGQYATTGSNNFSGRQYVSDVSNAIGFASTASIYTDGGLRVTKDSFVSGTAYFNNVVVYGTSSIEYITSSQLAIGTNIITLNTDTPSIRYGGISVFDSGSNNQSTGSLFWDSEKDKWIYSNPSGSTYDGGMLISGPRNSSGLGNEVGTTSCAVMIGQGGDHITSSGIFSYGNATCFYGTSFISSSGNVYFAGNVGIGTADPNTSLGAATVRGLVVNGGSSADVQFRLQNSSTGCTQNDGGLFSLAGDNSIYLWNYENAGLHLGTNNTDRLFITAGGCVGIGTINPTYQLQVTSATPSILLEATGSTGPAYLRFNNTTRSSTNYIALGGTTNDLFFTVNGADRFFISGSGNVGIGTSTPTSNINTTARILQICGPSSFGSIVLNGNGTQEGGVTGGGTAQGLYFDIAGDAIATNNQFYFRAGTTNSSYTSATVATISNTGVGCFSGAICSPAFVGGTINVATGSFRENVTISKNQNALTRLSISNTTSGTGAYVETSFTPDSSAGSGAIGKYSSATQAYKIVTASNTYLYNGAAGDIAILNDFSTGNIKLAAGGSTTAQMFICSSGNIGMGTTTPNYPLHVYRSSGISTITVESSTGQNIQFRLEEAGVVKSAITFVPADSSTRIFSNGGDRINITSGGSVCFLNTVCTPSGVRFGSGATTLNYFEEGCWQPVLRDGNSATVASDTFTNAGRYTRIGNRVFFTLYSRFNLSGVGSGDGGFTTNLRVSLPFTASNVTPSGTNENFATINISYWSRFYCLNSGDFPVGYVRSGEANAQLTLQNTSCIAEFTFGTSRLTRDSSAGIMISGHYFAS